MAKQLPKIDEVVIRSFGIADIRALPDSGNIEGHAAVFDQKTSIGDWFYEIIERGAFDGCNFDDVLFCVNHDTRKAPLARSRRNNGNSTMQISTDDKGLFVKASLDIENNPEAKALHSSISRGDIDGMSFMFYVSEEKWTELDTDMPTRHVLKISQVRELGPVNWPAYTGTDIHARGQQELENSRKALENARAKLENSENEREKLLLQIQIQNLAEV